MKPVVEKDKSSGFHLLEVHSPSVGVLVVTVFFILAVVVTLCSCLRRSRHLSEGVLMQCSPPRGLVEALKLLGDPHQYVAQVPTAMVHVEAPYIVHCQPDRYSGLVEGVFLYFFLLQQLGNENLILFQICSRLTVLVNRSHVFLAHSIFVTGNGDVPGPHQYQLLVVFVCPVVEFQVEGNCVLDLVSLHI